MTRLSVLRPAIFTAFVTGAALGADGEGQRFAVNEYFGMKYTHEPVSFDVKLPAPIPPNSLTLRGAESQVEPLLLRDGMTTHARLWTLVDFDRPGQKTFETLVGKVDRRSPFTETPAPAVDTVPVAEISNGLISVKLPVGPATFDSPRSVFGLPGPVVSISADAGRTWIGSGYLDTIARVTAVECTTTRGPVFFESRITYRFEGNRAYTARVRLFVGKPYVQLVEDFNVGGTSRFIFNYDDWTAPYFIGTTDNAQTKLYDVARDEADDFVKVEGQRCLTRLSIWTQHGYFRDKTETTGLVSRDGSLAVGGFFIRPDLWTRAKINHVDLYERPEVPGDRMTRGVSGLANARKRIAMEAWIIDGHREWALFAMPAGTWNDGTAPAGPHPQGGGGGVGLTGFQWNPALRKAHVVEGVWPLDRINRLPLAWNADGSIPKLEDTAPAGSPGFAGNINTVLKATEGRGGLQHFNGSEPSMRGGYTRQAATLLAFAKANPDARNAAALQKAGTLSTHMAGPAFAAYMAMDDSAYPGPRAMLPWAHPEALNPFYQGMENMNFNIDRYTSVLSVGEALEAMGHPDAKTFIDYARTQLDMQLDRYVYPQSGCWEESLGYAGSILRASAELAESFRPRGVDFYSDPRVINAYGFWAKILSPPDPGFDDMRIVPPIGDHGLSLWVQVPRLRTAIGHFAESPSPDARRVARELLWSLQQRKSLGAAANEATKPKPGQPPLKVNIPADLQPLQPNLSSQWLQGYGSILRGFGEDKRESFLVVRACQSWGHHHQDKGSLWGWFRNVHFFGDAAWGAPPGGTYWNPYKQGPASGTQIEFVGINNWPLPCKYPAAYISDEEYAPGKFDYVNARCMYPYNPKLTFTPAAPVIFHNGYERQVLFIHPDILVVRDNIQSTVPTVWRMHSYQVDGTTIDGPHATMKSPQGVTGQLAILHPPGATFTTSTVHDLPTDDGKGKIPNEPFGGKPGDAKVHGGKPLPYDTRSMVLRWQMPLNTPATWAFTTHEKEAPAKTERLDPDGKVTRITLADGREITILMNADPFTYDAHGISFDGTVGLVIKQSGKTHVHSIRAKVRSAP